MNMLRSIAACLVLGAILPAAALAQDADTPPPGTLVLGPLHLTPTVRLTDAGVDNNVFNEAVDPKSDFTFTVTPQADLAMRLRRLRLSYSTSVEYVYYQKYESERGTNSSATAKAEFDLGILRPYVSAQGISTRKRLNPEVDSRARHHDEIYGTGIAVSVASRTRVFVNLTRATTSFDEGEAFRGADLQQAFDGRRRTVDGGVSIDLTPVTRFSLTLAREEQRFVFSTDRDSNSWRIMPGFAFSTDGPLRGSASAGFRHFEPLSPALPGYDGLISSVTVGATLYGRHDLQGTVNRDVQYSYDEATDYYVGTTTALTWTTLLGGRFDVRGTASRAVMDYRGIADAGSDVVNAFGVGFGYRFTDRLRLGLNTEWSRRDSDRSVDRQYRNHRVFAGLTWGTTL
jgi:Putative beta-barrel porin 2